jgi:arabinogalactan oligomer / maltooligosaccharide transport system permease protein
VTGAPVAESAAFGRVDKLGVPLIISVLTGWLAFVALAAALIGASVGAEARRETAQRALSSAYALSAAINARGPDAAGQQAVLATFVGQTPGVIAARIVDAEQRALAASTAAADLRDAPAPRALKPAEKPLHDRARALSAARIAASKGGAPPAAAASVLLASDLGAARMLEVSVQGAPAAALAPAFAAPAAAGVAIILLLLTAAPARLRPHAALALMAMTCSALTLSQARMHEDAAVARAEAVIADTIDHVALVSQGLGGAPAPLDRTVDGAEGAQAREYVRVRADAATARGLIAAQFMALAIAAFGAFGAAGRVVAAARADWAGPRLLAPALIGLAALWVFPLLYGFGLRLIEAPPGPPPSAFAPHMVGIEPLPQRADLWAFWPPAATLFERTHAHGSLAVAAGWAGANLAIGGALALALAAAFNTQSLRAVAQGRALLVLPWAIPGFVAAFAWAGAHDAAFAAMPLDSPDTAAARFGAGLGTNLFLSFPFLLLVCLSAPAPTDLVTGAPAWTVTARRIAAVWPQMVLVAALWAFHPAHLIYLAGASAPETGALSQGDRLIWSAFGQSFAWAYAAVIAAVLLTHRWRAKPAAD